MRLILLMFGVVALYSAPPGIVIGHSPASSGLYIGSPSILTLSNGVYLASHDFFGPKSAEFEAPRTFIYRSTNGGANWTGAAVLNASFWAGLFGHRGSTYIMGTDRHHGRVVIRRSNDGGETWTEPRDARTGQLTSRAEYHTAPTPVIEHSGRLWRAFEDAGGGTEWGKRYRALMLSIPVDADPLAATNWTFSEILPRNPEWLEGKFNAWLEGNAVVSPENQIVNLLRVDLPSFPEKAAIVNLAADGRREQFDPERDFIDFPGGAKKFTIRFDPETRVYWTLANAVPPEFQTAAKPAGIRNTLALMRSANLRDWEIRAILLEHPDVKRHAFQYPDWQFEGRDIIAAVRTAFDDAEGGAHSAHDANYLTFHRIAGFRTLQKNP